MKCIPQTEPGVGDPRRERPVVPERVEGEHPPAPDVLEAGRPVGGDEGCGRERQNRLGKRDRRGWRRSASMISVRGAFPAL